MPCWALTEHILWRRSVVLASCCSQKEADTFSLETKFFSTYLCVYLTSFPQTSSQISLWWGLTCKGLLVKGSLLVCLEPLPQSPLSMIFLFIMWEFKLSSKPELYMCQSHWRVNLTLYQSFFLTSSFAFSLFSLWCLCIHSSKWHDDLIRNYPPFYFSKNTGMMLLYLWWFSRFSLTFSSLYFPRSVAERRAVAFTCV